MNDRNMKDLLAIRDRYVDLLFSGCFRENVQGVMTDTAEKLANSLVPGPEPDTYTWADIDFTDKSKTGAWQASRHYHRLESMLVNGGKQRLDGDTAFREKALGALRYWLIHDYRNPNWWHNDIGMPTHIGDIGLLLHEYLTAEEMEKTLELVSRGSIKTRKDIPNWGGANLIWGIYNSIRHALLSEDAELLRACEARIELEMAYTKEGIQPDGSFYQHGPRWYSGGYGASYTFDLSQLVWLFSGTSYAFPKKCIDIFLQHILDGQRRMMIHGYFDYAGVGREISRRGTLNRVEMIYGIRMLAAIEDLPRRDELLAFVHDIDCGAVEDKTDPYPATVWFPRISFLSQRKNGSYFGIKCHANDQYDAEICNSEGELCYNMSYGTHYCLMRRGNEYYDLNPIYDWAHVPGTTARIETDAELLAHRNWWCLPLPNDHVGALTAGDRGIVFEKPEHDGISLYTAFFVFDGNLVSLGAGIRDEKEDGKPLTTTVDQCLPVSPRIGKHRTSNGGFTYETLDPENEIVAKVEEREGSWKRNSFEEAYTHETGKVFLAFIPVKPGKDSYAYAVSPRGKKAGAKVLSNTSALQAIELADGTVMAVFHEAGDLIYKGKTLLHGEAGTCVIL